MGSVEAGRLLPSPPTSTHADAAPVAGADCTCCGAVGGSCWHSALCSETGRGQRDIGDSSQAVACCVAAAAAVARCAAAAVADGEPAGAWRTRTLMRQTGTSGASPLGRAPMRAIATNLAVEAMAVVSGWLCQAESSRQLHRRGARDRHDGIPPRQDRPSWGRQHSAVVRAGGGGCGLGLARPELNGSCNTSGQRSPVRLWWRLRPSWRPLPRHSHHPCAEHIPAQQLHRRPS